MNAVLVVEDDPVYRGALCRLLVAYGYVARPAASAEAARAAIAEAAPDFALVDLRLGDGSGLDVVRALAADAPACRTIVLTAFGTIPAAVEAMRLGAVDFRTKPIEGDEVLAALRAAAEPLPAETLDQVERNHILGVLQATGGNITEAARRLGLYRRTLQRKLQKLPRG